MLGSDQTHEVTVPSPGEKVFPAEEILVWLAVVLLHPGAYQDLMMWLSVVLEVKLWTSLSELQLTGCFFQWRQIWQGINEH